MCMHACSMCMYAPITRTTVICPMCKAMGNSYGNLSIFFLIRIWNNFFLPLPYPLLPLFPANGLIFSIAITNVYSKWTDNS